MISTAYVLAAMLRVAEPGVSDLSRVHLPIDDCEQACLESFLELRGHAPSLNWEGPAFARAQWLGWSVRESYTEGLSRFVTISKAIAIASRGSYERAHLLVTIARHESAFWRSVHDGTVRGAAGERGLWQVHPSLSEFHDCRPGVDLDSTLSCANVAASQIERARRMCGTTEGTIALYGSGKSCEPDGDWIEGVDSRMLTYKKTFSRQRAKSLGFDAQLALLILGA